MVKGSLPPSGRQASDAVELLDEWRGRSRCRSGVSSLSTGF